MHHDRPLEGTIIDASLEAIQAERVAVLPDIGVFRSEETQTRAVCLSLVRKQRREFAPLPCLWATSS
jgi:hypothetical protein